MIDHQSVIVAGGRAVRLGGIDKGALRGRGGSLIERAVRASDAATSIAIVGRGRHAPAGRLLRVDEEPRFGGPVAAVAAGVRALDDRPVAAWTLILAADLPEVELAVPELLGAVEASDGADGVLAADDEGRRQPLLAAYRTVALRDALRSLPTVAGTSMRALLHPLALSVVVLGDRLCADVDTPADVLRHGLRTSERSDHDA